MARAILNRFAAPAYACLFEVRNQTGYSRSVRTADAVAMSLYPSRGLDLHGIEVKSHRSDWINELKQPQKADEIARFCNFWWLAVDDSSIVREGEVPATWGLLVRRGETLVCKKQAERLDAEPLDRKFVAAILRNITANYVARSTVSAVVEQRLQESKESNANSIEFYRKQAERDYKTLRSAVDEFEKASGLRISEWNAGNVGRAVNTLMTNPAESFLSDIQNIRRIASRILAASEDHKTPSPIEDYAI